MQLVLIHLMMSLDLTLTWKHLFYKVGQIADNAEHCFFSQILIGYMWCVISEKQNNTVDFRKC